MNKILFIDDDTEFGETFSELLLDNGYDVDYINNVSEALKKEKEKGYDLIIIDLYLEKFTGVQVVELIRNHNNTSKIMIMTNSIDDQDEIRLLRLGIDEYLRKNTSFFVMLERIRKVLISQKSQNIDDLILQDKNEKVVVDINKHLVEKEGSNIYLTHLEYDLLIYLLKNKNVLLSRESILENVWKLKEEEVHIDSRTVDVHIKNLRRKLKVTAIHSIRGVGYRWYEK